MAYPDGEVTLPECHIVKRKDMQLFCFFDVFIAGFRSATVVAKHEHRHGNAWENHSPSSFIHQYPVNWLLWEELPWNGSGQQTCVKPVPLPLLCCQKSIARKSDWKPITRRFSLHFAGQFSRQG